MPHAGLHVIHLAGGGNARAQIMGGLGLADARDVVILALHRHQRGDIGKADRVARNPGRLAQPLVQSGYFPALVTHMIKLGERSGELEPMLKIISENYEDQVQSKISGLTSVLEPIMMICLGVAIGFIVFAVVIPMMNMNSLR